MKQKSRAEAQNIKKGETEQITMENHKFTKVETRKKKQWRDKITKRPR